MYLIGYQMRRTPRLPPIKGLQESSLYICSIPIILRMNTFPLELILLTLLLFYYLALICPSAASSIDYELLELEVV